MNRLLAADPMVREVAQAAINKMLGEGHFSICTIDSILKLTGGIPPQREYDMLRALHCVDFKAMSPRLRVELPRLMQVVLEGPPIVYQIGSPQEGPNCIDAAAEIKQLS